MAPTLRPGDHVLVDLGAYRRSEPEVGDIVLATHPHLDVRIIKRVVSIAADGRLELRGDNPDLSSDSREYGPIDPAALQGRLVARFP
jgi:nickel-type superoxide dismutase maturation protease